MHHLSSMDAAFLHFETPEMPMHVGSLALLDLPEGYEGDFYEDAKAYLAARLHLCRRFAAQARADALRPGQSGVGRGRRPGPRPPHPPRHPAAPGSFDKLEQLVGRLHSPLMDRSRPLWEIYIIEGLKAGQVALYTKMHHAGIDGQAGVALAKVLYSAIGACPRRSSRRARGRAATATSSAWPNSRARRCQRSAPVPPRC